MRFRHSDAIWKEFPALVPGVIFVEGITGDVAGDARVAPYWEIASSRLATSSEGEFPEVQAWRRAFSTMGLKPTQYRSASESLLRRFKKEKALPQIHPLIDVCNAVSIAFGIPVAAFDVDKVVDGLEVRHADGDESYLTFSEEVEHPEPGEVIFADAARQAHARRWVNRQSGLSAIRPTTSRVLIVSEGMHDAAAADVPRLITALSAELTAIWGSDPRSTTLSQATPEFEF